MNNKLLIKFALVALGSGAIGFAAGWFIKEKLDDKFFDEIREQITEAEANLASSNEELEKVRHDFAQSAINKYNGVEVNPVIPKKVILTEADMAARGRDEALDKNKKWAPEKQDYTGPKVISLEDWNDEMEQDPDWDKLEYTYFPTKDFLCDFEAGLRIMDYTYEIGSEALDILRNLDKEKQEDAIVYVRNPYLGCDIQITVDWDEPNAEWFDVPNLNDVEGGVKG